MKKLIMFSPPLVFVICMVLLCACHESDNEQILDSWIRSSKVRASMRYVSNGE